MRQWQYFRKLETYRAHVESDAWHADRRTLPALLFVFRNWLTERQVLRIASDQFQGLHELTVLATTVWRLKHHGPLVAIWRGPLHERRTVWPPLVHGGVRATDIRGGSHPARAELSADGTVVTTYAV